MIERARLFTREAMHRAAATWCREVEEIREASGAAANKEHMERGQWPIGTMPGVPDFGPTRKVTHARKRRAAVEKSARRRRIPPSTEAGG